MVGKVSFQRKWWKHTRVAILLTLIGSILNGVASAHYTTCSTSYDPTIGARPTDCPEFSPDVRTIVDTPYVDWPTALEIQYYQADQESAAFDVTYMLPKGWQFATASVRAGQKANGLPATECTDLYDGSAPMTLKRGELLSASEGMKTKFGPDTNRSEGDYGFNPNKPAVDSPPPDNPLRPTLSFLNWNLNTGVANLCLYLMTQSAVDATAREFLLPMQLTQLSNDPTYGWSLHVDLTPIFRNEWAYNNALSLIENGFHINASTAGNWNINSVSGNRESVTFSRAPAQPEQTAMSAIFKVCREGPNDPSSGPVVCRNNDVLTVAEANTVSITPPPRPGVLDYGRITHLGTLLTDGPSQPGLQPEGFSLVNGGNMAQVVWLQPGLQATQTVKGYVLALARTQDQDSLHFEYLVTQRYLVDSRNRTIKDAAGNPVPNPDFDLRAPCGDDGKDENCTFTFRFPMTGIGGHILDGEGKYDIALVTIYATGVRTDGRCDNGTPEGAVCDPNRPPFTVASPGLGAWQFLMRRDPWPNVFFSTSTSGDANTPGTAVPVPRFVLFVNYPLKQAQFFRWGANTFATKTNASVPLLGEFGASSPNAKDGPGEWFAGSSDTIQGTDQTGVVSFGNFKPDGAARSFAFSGSTSSQNAVGNFILWDPHNWTLGVATNPISPSNPFARQPCITGPCSPTAYLEVFNGKPV